MPLTLKPSSKPDLQRHDSSTSQLSTEKIQFKSQLTSINKLSTPFNFQLKPSCYIDQYISSASKQLAPYAYRTAKIQKKIFCANGFSRLSVPNLQADDSNPNFQSVKKTCPS